MKQYRNSTTTRCFLAASISPLLTTTVFYCSNGDVTMNSFRSYSSQQLFRTRRQQEGTTCRSNSTPSSKTFLMFPNSGYLLFQHHHQQTQQTPSVLKEQKRLDTTVPFGPEENPNAPDEEFVERCCRKLKLIERRIKHAPDYGGYFCTQMLNDGFVMIQEIEDALKERKLEKGENAAVELIEELRILAREMLYELEAE